MNLRYLNMIVVALFYVATAIAQNPDSSANGLLKGNYFVREVLMTGGSDGAVTAASSVIGVAAFDGNGNYAFTGQGTTLASGPNTALSLSGTYSVGSNGFFHMTSLADQTDVDYGGVSTAVGPSAFVASATEADNVTMLVGIPVGANISNSSFSGNYTAGAIDFPNADITAVRQATFNLTADGAGNLGNVAVTGAGANLGGTVLNQTDTGVTYSFSTGGSGTVKFGAATSSQLVSGTKTFFISADGNLILGGSPTGYDMLVGMRSLSGSASNNTATGLYYMAALEDEVNPPGLTTNLIDAFYGSINGTSAGISISHNRFQSLQFDVYDYTFDNQYTVPASGTIPSGPDNLTVYSYSYGVTSSNGQALAYIARGDVVDDNYYSLTLGLAMPNYSGNGVYLAPNGIVNSASFAPITNPIAPNELITLFGTGLASAVTNAANLPLPTTLGDVQVTINGTAVPLDYVSPTQIVALVPTSISAKTGYATLQVVNNSVPSNSVTVYTNDTSPGVFAINPVAAGMAAAQHSNYNLVTSNDPANIGETIMIYTGGLGAVTPAVIPDGGPAPSNPASTVNDPLVSIDFGQGTPPLKPPFAGLTPTTAGLYQINVAIPSGTQPNVLVDVGTTDGYTSEAALNVAGINGSAVAKAHIAKSRLAQRKMGQGKAKIGLKSRLQ